MLDVVINRHVHCAHTHTFARTDVRVEDVRECECVCVFAWASMSNNGQIGGIIICKRKMCSYCNKISCYVTCYNSRPSYSVNCWWKFNRLSQFFIEHINAMARVYTSKNTSKSYWSRVLSTPFNTIKDNNTEKQQKCNACLLELNQSSAICRIYKSIIPSKRSKWVESHFIRQ